MKNVIFIVMVISLFLAAYNPVYKDITIEKDSLVDVGSADSSFVLEISKAGVDNYWHRRFYDCPKCMLQHQVAIDLIAANQEFHKLGYSIKLWDCYRPLDVQRVLYRICSNPRYIMPPHIGSDHNRAAAVDITLVDSKGQELDMGTDYEDFSHKTSRGYKNFPDTILSNRELLKTIMEKHNFKSYSREWWHFRHIKARSYELLNIPIKCD